MPQIQPARLAVKLSAAGERSVRSGHPWLFSNSIIKLNKEGSAGDIAVIFGMKKNEVIGVGLFDPDSPIRIKMLHANSPAKIDADFFLDRISRAFALRQPLLETDTNSYRLLFGENDGMPGFIADVYADVMVVKLYSKIWLPFLEKIVKQLIDISEARTVVLRLNRKLQSDDSIGLTDGIVLYGELSDEDVQFKEHGIIFSANVIHGHKTGYFLDHRYNRKQVGKLSKGKKVLDVFAYAGGFSVHALVGGAKEVTSVDISEHALEAAIGNANSNEFNGKHQVIAGEAFNVMKELIDKKSTYDIVVIDPPSFAKRQSEVTMALKKYAQLAEMGSRLVAANGVLVLASCSSRVTEEDFFGTNKKALDASKRHYSLQLKTAHDIDHPVIFPEGAYLKCGYYKF